MFYDCFKCPLYYWKAQLDRDIRECAQIYIRKREREGERERERQRERERVTVSFLPSHILIGTHSFYKNICLIYTCFSCTHMLVYILTPYCNWNSQWQSMGKWQTPTQLVCVHPAIIAVSYVVHCSCCVSLNSHSVLLPPT